MADQPALGFRCHSGWAVAVAVLGTVIEPVVVDRQRIVLVDERLPRQPYHAVAEGGADRRVIRDVERDARSRAVEALGALPPSAIVAVVAPHRSLPSELDRILASHALLHAAEGALYEDAVLDAAEAVGIAATTIEVTSLTPSPEVDALRQRLGPPWQRDHKLAAMAALLALEGAR